MKTKKNILQSHVVQLQDVSLILQFQMNSKIVLRHLKEKKLYLLQIA